MEIVTVDETLIARILATKIRFNLRRNRVIQSRTKIFALRKELHLSSKTKYL